MKLFSIFIVAGLFIFTGSISLSAQIAGISNSKVTVLCPDVVGVNKLEFEPSYIYSSSSQIWNSESKLTPIMGDDKNIYSSTEFGFRITYGAAPNLEAGVFIPGKGTGVSVGAKYQLFENEKLAFGTFGGANLCTEKEDYFDKEEKGANSIQAGMGFVARYIFRENLTWDLDMQYLNTVVRKLEGHKGDVFVNSELGCYFGNYQFCAGFSYMNSMYSEKLNQQELLSLLLGGTIETGENFIIIWGIPIDVYGKNIEKSLGFTMAFTMTIN